MIEDRITEERPRTKTQDIYNIARWSEGYFDVSDKGTLIAFPDSHRNHLGIDLPELTKKIQEIGLSFPVLVRFTDILKNRFDKLRRAFHLAMQEHHYTGGYMGVYPIKVNQQRRVVEEILRHGGQRVGLEAGSKPELMAVLALSAHPNSIVVCNGYKDREYIRLALIGQLLGHRVYIILEKFSELDLIIEEAAKMNVKPNLGIRVRLASTGTGKWQSTGGPKSKFGFSAAEVLRTIDRLRANQSLDCLQLIHFHLGSQIPNIRDIQRAMRECARYYAELRELGAPITIVDVGGGLAVDYEGTHSRSSCSKNYSIQEYANNIVYTFAEICMECDLPNPEIMTESGRAMTAHHAVLITNVIDIERAYNKQEITMPKENEPQLIHDLWYCLQHLSDHSALEAYHDVSYWMEEIATLYTHGVMSLAERARGEQLHFAICAKIRHLLNPSFRAHREVLDELNEKLADKLFCNFSLFQSLPDAWAIDQLFPIVPLSRLNQPTMQRAVLQDITCDSDGRIDLYVNHQGLEKTLPLPVYDPLEPYLLGIFLVGAYQEILGDMHNLFGDTDSVHVELLPEGGYQLVQPVQGDTIESVLRYVHFNKDELIQSYNQQLAKTNLPPHEYEFYLQELTSALSNNTYLKG